VAGRGFDERDDAGQPRVMIVNQALARGYFGNGDPIGQFVFIGADVVPWQIIGVAEDVRQFALDRAAEPQFFADFRQWSISGVLFPVGAYYVVRSASDIGSLVSSIRPVVRDLEDRATLFNVAPMEHLVTSKVTQPRLNAVLLGIFAGVAVALAAIGIYGVMAYSVAQRTREIGVRMALGAQRMAVMRLVLVQTAALTGAGMILGLAGAGALTRYLQGMLFGITPLDPSTYLAVTLLFIAVAGLAAFVPARRATHVDPVIALRCE